jgi:hypothetical protein
MRDEFTIYSFQYVKGLYRNPCNFKIVLNDAMRISKFKRLEFDITYLYYLRGKYT